MAEVVDTAGSPPRWYNGHAGSFWPGELVARHCCLINAAFPDGHVQGVSIADLAEVNAANKHPWLTRSKD